MSINKQIDLINEQIGKNVSLVAVSKTKSELKIKEAYDSGQRVLVKIKFRSWFQNKTIYLKILVGI